NQLPASYFALGDKLLNNAANQVANPFAGIIVNPTSNLRLPTVQATQLLRPYPQYTSVGAFRKPQGNSLYHSFTLRVEKRISHGLSTVIVLTTGLLIVVVSQQVSFLGHAGTRLDYADRMSASACSAPDIKTHM